MREKRGSKLFIPIAVVAGLGMSLVSPSVPAIADGYRGHRHTQPNFSVHIGNSGAFFFSHNRGHGDVRKHYRKPRHGHIRNHFRGSRHGHFNRRFSPPRHGQFGHDQFGDDRFSGRGGNRFKFNGHRHGRFQERSVMRYHDRRNRRGHGPAPRSGHGNFRR